MPVSVLEYTCLSCNCCSSSSTALTRTIETTYSGVHDGHTTMLLGAAALLKKIESQIVGTVRLVFQPAEEGGAGMKRMVEEGVHLMEPKAQLGFGMHVWPTLPTGIVASRPGALMAAAEMFQITLTGKGGHAAMPHQTVDPIVAAASLISSLQVSCLFGRNSLRLSTQTRP